MKPERKKPFAAPKSKVGRPAKITLPVVAEVGKLIALGLTEEQACLAQNPPVNLGSYRSACNRNEEFATAVKKAQAEFLVRAVKAISEGGEVEYGLTADGKPSQRVKQWTGLAWILERRHKPQFNRVEGHAITDSQGGELLTEKDMLELEQITKSEVKKGINRG
jgi:hypothetical protein